MTKEQKQKRVFKERPIDWRQLIAAARHSGFLGNFKPRRVLAAAALLAITAGAWWSIANHLLPQTPGGLGAPGGPEGPGAYSGEPAFQAQVVTAPLPRLTPQHQRYTAALTGATGITAAHPTQASFIVATAEQTIQSIGLDGHTRTLAQTAAPVTWLSFSRNGQHLAAADQQSNLYLFSGDDLSVQHQWTAQNLPVNVNVDNDGRVTWIDITGALFTTPAPPGSAPGNTSGTTGAASGGGGVSGGTSGGVSGGGISRVLDCKQTLSANNAQAFVRQRGNHKQLEFQVDGQTLPVTAQLAPHQSLHDFDAAPAAPNGQTLAAQLSDGLLLVVRQTAEGQYRLDDHAFAAPTGNARVRLSESGHQAVVLTDQLYRLDTNRMSVTAQTPLPPAAGPAYDLVWRQATDEIAVAQAQQGLLWQP